MDLKLNADTWDLDLSFAEAHLVSGREAIVQHLKLRLQLFLGEWFLDAAAGLPYFQRIFVRHVNEPDVKRIYLHAVQQTPGVLSVDTFSLALDRAGRVVHVSGRVTTTDGVLDFTQPLSLNP